MNNVVDLPIDFKTCTYFKRGEVFGVTLRNKQVVLENINNEKFYFLIRDITGSVMKIEIDRKMLAEFLWVSAYFVDSEKRYSPNGTLVGINY